LWLAVAWRCPTSAATGSPNWLPWTRGPSPAFECSNSVSDRASRPPARTIIKTAEGAGEYVETLLDITAGPQMAACSGAVWETVGVGAAVLAQARYFSLRRLVSASPPTLAAVAAARQRNVHPRSRCHRCTPGR
jgi:hypothetical protein